MKKLLFALLAFACVALPFVACSDDEDEATVVAEQQEVSVTVSDITDSSAVLNCVYTPVNSATYQVRIGEVVSDEYSEGRKLQVSRLAPGRKYTAEVTAYDADHKAVSTGNVESLTTGTPDNGGDSIANREPHNGRNIS